MISLLVFLFCLGRMNWANECSLKLLESFCLFHKTNDLTPLNVAFLLCQRVGGFTLPTCRDHGCVRLQLRACPWHDCLLFGPSQGEVEGADAVVLCDSAWPSRLTQELQPHTKLPVCCGSACQRLQEKEEWCKNPKGCTKLPGLSRKSGLANGWGDVD